MLNTHAFVIDALVGAEIKTARPVLCRAPSGGTVCEAVPTVMYSQWMRCNAEHAAIHRGSVDDHVPIDRRLGCGRVISPVTK